MQLSDTFTLLYSQTDILVSFMKVLRFDTSSSDNQHYVHQQSFTSTTHCETLLHNVLIYAFLSFPGLI